MVVNDPEFIFNELKKTAPSDRVSFPPPVASILDGEFLEYEEGKRMLMRFPIKPEYDNPFHITFGGVYGMFFDMAFGPFSGLVTQAATTSLDMNITYLKPLSIKDEYVYVEAIVESLSKQFLILSGKAYKTDDTLVATCTSRMMIFDPSRMKI